MEKKEIRVEENGLKVVFEVQENGMVELKQFATKDQPDFKIRNRDPEASYGIAEVQITGKSTRGMHAYKHNQSSASEDFKYVNHVLEENEAGKKLVIHIATVYGVNGEYHMQFFKGIPVVQVWTVLENKGTEDVGLEYVSSFIYHGLCQEGVQPYFEKTQIYTPHNSWDCEAQWKKDDLRYLNVSGMPVDGFNTPGFGINRYCYGGFSSWSS